ncbi:MAG: restriction endonuclease subunit S [Gammaproteobacteria bacterium]|nr:restriction endonuclease subunit S [Gammaproteobacteria bacterium]
MHAKGVVLRDAVPGSDIKTKRQQVCRAGEFLVAEIDAKMGGFGIVPEALEGAVVSSHYFLFAIDGAQLDRRFLDYFIRTTGFRNQVDAQGSTNYAAIRPASVAGYQMPLPPLPEQQAIVSRLDTLADKARQVNEHLDAIERDADRLLAVRFRDAIADAPLRPMAEVAPLVRREIRIDPQANYTELGIRSFFKGTFQRRTMEGADYSWQKLFSVKASDLIFSNIMAWEQAIAIAKPDDEGCVGNHRMLTCEVNTNTAAASFLYYYFTTSEGFAKIGAASPGTAARNKTLKAPDLMEIEVPVPGLSTQRIFDILQAKVAELKARHATIRQANDALIPATLERVFSTEVSAHA